MVIRPEVRWDWFDNANVQNNRPFGESGPAGATFSDELNQFLFAVDAIISY